MTELINNYRKYIPATFFILGFLFDIITLGEIDETSNILVHLLYLIISISILILEYLQIEKLESNKKWIHLIFNHKIDIFHFCLGSLLSSFALFYFKSASISNSYLMLLIITIFLILNEFESFQKKGIIVRTVLLFLCYVTFLIYFIPIIIGKSNTLIFLLSILLSVASSFCLKTWLNKKNGLIYKNTKNLFVPHVAVAIFFTFLYFAKILPPLPLSLKYIGVFHDIKKSNGHYVTTDYKPSWKFWHNGDQDFKYQPNDKVYIFTKIFSPAGFKEKINIRWSIEKNGEYKTSDIIPLSVKGGRRNGYRAYTFKRNIKAGKWQVKIETNSGLEIGRINFTISHGKNIIENKNVMKRM